MCVLVNNSVGGLVCGYGWDGDLALGLGGGNLIDLRSMRRFYFHYPIRETLSLELSWSHYCRLIRIENSTAREWYTLQAICGIFFSVTGDEFQLYDFFVHVTSFFFELSF